MFWMPVHIHPSTSRHTCGGSGHFESSFPLKPVSGTFHIIQWRIVLEQVMPLEVQDLFKCCPLSFLMSFVLLDHSQKYFRTRRGDWEMHLRTGIRVVRELIGRLGFKTLFGRFHWTWTCEFNVSEKFLKPWASHSLGKGLSPVLNSVQNWDIFEVSEIFQWQENDFSPSSSHHWSNSSVGALGLFRPWAKESFGAS